MPNRLINIKSKNSVQKLNSLKSFNWYSLDYKSTSYVVTTLTVKRTTAQKYQKIIKIYAKENGLHDIEVKIQSKHKLLYMTRDSFERFFSLDSIIPSTSQASEQLQIQFSDAAMDQLFKKDRERLNDLPSLTWYYFKKDSLILLIADLTSFVKDDNNNIANYYCSAVNRFSRHLQRQNEIKASHKGNHNLLIMDENSFNNYFSARSLNCPNTFPAPEDLIMRFNDKKLYKISVHDENNFNKLTSMNWFHLDEKNVQYIITILVNSSVKLNQLVSSISHVGNVYQDPIIKGASIPKHSILYLKKDAFDKLFEYIQKAKPKTLPADNALQEKFANRRRVKHDQEMWADKEFSIYHKTHLTEPQSEMFLATNTEPQRNYLVKFNMSIKSLLSQPEPQVLESNDRSPTRFLINR